MDKIKRERSASLYKKAANYFPGGVNSPVRAFKAVGGTPLFIKRGKGARLFDEDNNEFIDFCASWGPLILGHADEKVIEAICTTAEMGTSFGAPTALENDLAELILTNHRFIEKLRFVSSGTEAVMSAIRLARGYTGRSKILKFEGCYHGHSDSLLVKAGSGLVTFGETSSAGIPKEFVENTLVVHLDDEEAIRSAFRDHKDEIAAIIIEPIPANNGLLLQRKEYLEFLREITRENGTLLIFDEVISGFRVGFEGAAGIYNIDPDIITFGKIIGGGLPVGAYASSREIMKQISPDGPVYQAGTLSGNPVAMAAGLAQLKRCAEKGFYENLDEKTEKFCAEINTHAERSGYYFRMVRTGSIFWPAFSTKTIRKASEIEAAGIDKFRNFHASLLNNGIYTGPSGYEVGFISSAHTDDDLKIAENAFKMALDETFGK